MKISSTGENMPKQNAKVCIHGHIMTKENTYITRKGYKVCRECKSKAAKQYVEYKKAELQYYKDELKKYKGY